MKLRTRVLLTTTVFLLFASVNLFAGNQDNPLVEAIKLFDQAKYEAAEEILKPLLSENPDQLMVNYYYGACRTENAHYGEDEIAFLLKGSTGESPLKTDYYLAVQYHAQNRWEEALRHYNAFKDESGEQELEELNLSEKISQCENRINPFTPSDKMENDIAPVPLPKTKELPENDSFSETTEPVYPVTEEEDSLSVAPTENPQSYDEKPAPKPSSMHIEFNVNGEMTYLDTADFQTEEGLHNFLVWNQTAQKLDALKTQMDEWRTAYANAKTSSERNTLGEKIIAAEGELFTLQKQTKEHQLLSQKAENEYWNNQPEVDKLEFIKQLNQRFKTATEKEVSNTTPIDSTLILPNKLINNYPDQIPAEEKESNELVYKIQIGAYSRGLPSYVKKLFDKLSYIRKIENYTDDRGVVVYTTGNLNKFEDAVKMQNQVRLEGIEDAFVVPYFNGKRITLEEAKKIEQENDR